MLQKRDLETDFKEDCDTITTNIWTPKCFDGIIFSFDI